MKQITLPPTESEELVISCETSTVIEFVNKPSSAQSAPASAISIDDLIAEFSQVRGFANDLRESRAALVDKFYAEDGDTIKTLRLRHGWSQQELADMLGTSQSHVARIENKGDDHIWLKTCRKLCEVFEIDLNTLNALIEQQANLVSKG